MDDLKPEKADITDEKMAALARFGRRMGHDVCNILSAVDGFAALVEDDLGKGHPSHELVARIRKCVRRGFGEIDQSLTFAYSRPEVQRAVDLKQVIEDYVTELDDTSVTCTLPDTPVPIKMKDSDLTEMISELLKNAFDAEADQITLTLTSDAQVGVLVVSDNGSGIAPELQDKVLEPFIKGPKSTSLGLGLAHVYGVVRSVSGSITIDSSPDGTEICVKLPLEATS